MVLRERKQCAFSSALERVGKYLPSLPPRQSRAERFHRARQQQLFRALPLSTFRAWLVLRICCWLTVTVRLSLPVGFLGGARLTPPFGGIGTLAASGPPDLVPFSSFLFAYRAASRAVSHERMTYPQPPGPLIQISVTGYRTM